MVQTRSAESGILGFTYQFLQSAIKILSLQQPEATFTIEGIEDLDITSTGEELLVQYKYHKGKKFSLSAIDKPVALMFKHYVDSSTKTPNYYVLFSYFGQKHKRDLDKDVVVINNHGELKELFKCSNAKSILKGTNWTEENEINFLKLLKFEQAEDFDEACIRLLTLIEQNFGVSTEEGKSLYFSNAIYYINQLAIKEKQVERTITRQQFIDYLSSQSQIVQYAIIERIYGKQEYIRNLKKYIHAKNIKRNTCNYIVHLKNVNANTPRFIIDLAKKFVVQEGKRDVLPLTIILNDTKEKISQLKTTLLQINLQENSNLIFNDGYETFHFQPSVFSFGPLLVLQKNQQKIRKASYNYRILSFQTFTSFATEISLDNPVHFIINDAVEVTELKNSINSNALKISGLHEYDLLNLLGG